jgi:hypothetical protein
MTYAMMHTYSACNAAFILQAAKLARKGLTRSTAIRAQPVTITYVQLYVMLR